MARRGAWLPARQDHSSETKPFYLTSEFLVFSDLFPRSIRFRGKRRSKSA